MNKPAGDDTFLQLINNNKRIIYKICHAYCQQPDDREDLAQEIIYQLWRSFQQTAIKVKFSTWMYRVALNTAISYYRRDRKTPRAAPTEHLIILSDESNREAEDETQQQLHLLQVFIQALPELERALMLLYLDGKTYAEIAEILGISESNAGTKLSRIKQQLREKMKTAK